MIAEISAEYVNPKKRTWGTFGGPLDPHDRRDSIVDFVREWSETTEIPSERFVGWIGIARGKFYA